MRHLIVAFVVACSSTAKEPARRPIPESPGRHTSPDLMPLQWWLGDWAADHGTEHWVASRGAMYGIGLANDGSFEVMIVDDGEGPGMPDGKLRFIASPGGGDSTQFDLRDRGDRSVTFENPEHDFPKTISYRVPAAGQLTATVAGGAKSESYAFRASTRTSAPALEAADLAFAADVATRGVDGWVAAFAPDGGMLRDGKRITGAAAIADAMGPLLGGGKLGWRPIASGVRGGVGFTVGEAWFTGSDGWKSSSWNSSYVTIWKQQPDGSWKVWFDTGRRVNE